MSYINTLKDYQLATSRTFKKLDTVEADRIHLYSGVETETGELLDPFKKFIAYNKAIDWVNVKEELADTCWYLSEIETRINNTVLPDLDIEKLNIFQNPHSGERAIDYYEILYMNNRLLEWKRDWCLRPDNIGLVSFVSMGYYLGFDMKAALNRNIEKLALRYPEKFTEYHAINRDIDAERKVLESNE